MSQTDPRAGCVVVGLFDRHDDAMDVVRDLEGRGVPRSAIRIEQKPGGDDPEARRGIFQKLRDVVGGQDTHRYAEGIHRGGTFVSATVPETMAEDAVHVMERHDAVDIDERTEAWRAAGWQEESARSAGATEQTRTHGGTEEDLTLPVVEERLVVGKRNVERGRVRVYSRVTERPVEEQVQLHEEHVYVERRPVNRPVDEGSRAFQDEEFELVENAEEAVVGKEARVVEEVHVGKEGRDRTETVRDSVRRTDVAVEADDRQTRGGPGSFTSDFQDDFRTRYASSGGTYEEYQPAYQWGYELANEDAWRGRSWSEVEPYAQRDWEDRNPGTWDRFKAAIRYGWDRLTGQQPETSKV